MWGDPYQETGAMEYSYSASYTEPKLIDFFKCETPLRKDHGFVGEQTSVHRPDSLQLGRIGNGASAQELPAIAEGARSDLKLELPSGTFVDFLSGNGDDPSHHLAVSRSSSDEGYKRPMAPKWIQEAIAKDQWSLITARPSLPNLALKLLSPSPTGTQASGTSPPKTPTFDMELNSRITRPQPCVTSIPDHERESSAFSADSDRRLFGSFLPDVADRSNSKLQFNGKPGSRVYCWSPQNGQKRLKIRDQSDGDEHDGAAMVERSNVEFPMQNLREKDEEKEAVVQAAASLLSLSSNEDDWQRTSSAKKLRLRRNVSSSSLAVIGEGSDGKTKAPSCRGNGGDGNVSSSSLAVTGEGETKAPSCRGNGGDGNVSSSSLAVTGEGETKAPNCGNGNDSSSSSLPVTGEGSERESGDGCSSGSSVLSRPSNKRRYRLVVDLLAESPRVR